MRRADIEVPNRFVAVNAWKRLACYPQGSFYPLSPGLSIQHREITKPDFRPCSTCWSRSQAPLCFCALRMISNHSEGTFGRLRYSLGGDRPSQTAHQTLSFLIHLGKLDIKCTKGGIPSLTPARLASYDLCLPPILYIIHPMSISSYSKAPWGLFVLSRVAGVFTGSLISPSLLLRQCPNRYAFRAGRNLPDKEFRYLRTVIVTAAVYWGLSSCLRFIS